MYATKRRQRTFKRVREPPKAESSSNPSKRHRERLNGELETVAALLPYDQAVITRLDKLSVLRLAVSYLQVKTHFQVCLHQQVLHQSTQAHPYNYHSQHSQYSPYVFVDKVHTNENTVFKGLCGFVLILNENGEIYYVSDNIETYLGFHQSDILHQPIYDMIHSEDREEMRQQLRWNYSLPAASSWQDLFTPDGDLYLERSASARFRCLLDNTCGFLRIDIRGRLSALHGLPPTFLATRSENTFPVLGFVAICSPFVPPPNLDGVDNEPFLKTKHSMDLAIVSTDHKAKYMLELEDKTLPRSFYSIIHPEDALCLADAHKEVVKNGASGLLVYRVIGQQSLRQYWLQSSCRLFYKNGKPESIGCTHRLLTEVEGSTLLEKRASLSAKLLSFDDSLLQSPKLLQSTAALNMNNQTTSTPTSSTHKGSLMPAPAPATSFVSAETQLAAAAAHNLKMVARAAKKQQKQQLQQQQIQQQQKYQEHQQHQQQQMVIPRAPCAVAAAQVPPCNELSISTDQLLLQHSTPSLYMHPWAQSSPSCASRVYLGHTPLNDPYAHPADTYPVSATPLYPLAPTPTYPAAQACYGPPVPSYDSLSAYRATPALDDMTALTPYWPSVYAVSAGADYTTVTGSYVPSHVDMGLVSAVPALPTTPAGLFASKLGFKMESSGFSMAEVTNTLLGS